METKVTVIVDNIACEGLAGEWGLSILVEYMNKKILVDAEVRDVAKKIQDTGIDFVCTGHCTKERAYHNVMKYTGLDMSTLQASDGKYYSDDGKELMEMIREGISKDTSVGPQFKGAAFDYISEQISMVIKKGWNNIPDINMNIAYARNTGFYLVN